MPLASRPNVRKQLYRQEVYQVLRHAIVVGELAPGERIKDTELASQLGISRTPVREALSQLVDAGLVESMPGVATRVTPLSMRNVSDTLKVLRVLDELAVYEAVPRFGHEEIGLLRQANKRFGRAVEASDVEAALQADKEFHGVFVGAADNLVLARSVDQLLPQIERILHRKFSTLLGGRETVDHHARLIALAEARDAEGVAAASASHWLRLGGLIQQLFDDE